MRAVEDRSAGDIDIRPSARIQPCYKRAPLAFQARIPYQAAIKPAKKSTPTMAPTSDSSVASGIAAHPIGGSLILGYDPRRERASLGGSRGDGCAGVGSGRPG